MKVKDDALEIGAGEVWPILRNHKKTGDNNDLGFTVRFGGIVIVKSSLS